MRKNGFLFFWLLIVSFSFAQTDVYPTHWWTGMKMSKIQSLIRSENISGPERRIAMVSYPGVRVLGVEKLENPNYLLVNLDISAQAKPGSFPIKIVGGNKPVQFTYELKARDREDGNSRVQGVTSKDLVYLIMPDRFANGDPSNDAFDSYKDKEANRNSKYARHGGDLKGAQDHLDYLSDLGVTTIWLTPLTENDMPKMREGSWDMSGYHGYWFTDHYKVDKRFGGNEAYKEFITTAHRKGLKVIQDAVYNHIGLEHWIYLDPPSKDWINQWPTFTPPNHRVETMFDPYGSDYDKTNMVKGWFVRHLPDLNLANTSLANYLIQHAIWSVEEFGFDGFRVDTYKYCDENFLNKVNAALVKEYPGITTFVEAWANNEQGNAYFVQNNLNIPFKHNAGGALDFPLCFSMHAAMNQPNGWTEGVNRLYMTLAQDRAYKDPLTNCIFLDNHDLDRVYSVIGEDWNKMKWGMNWLLTLRGIPQLYYGTEILMKNFKQPTDAEVRLDFLGGFPGDAVNKFTAAGRTEKENEAFNYIRNLARFRKSSSALTTGKTMQFIVRDGVYTYFRYDDKQTVMVITNTGDKIYTPDWTIFKERTAAFKSARDIQTGKMTPLENLQIKPKEGLVLELMK